MIDARFGQNSRLRGRGEFRHVFEKHARSADAHFRVLARGNNLGFPRLGLIVSRKIARKAVARNRIKRIIRESFRSHQQALGGLDVIVIGRENIADVSNAILFESLRGHWLGLSTRCVNP